jgi:hypothetical protein
MDDLEIIINSLGEQNEELDRNQLENIKEEIESISEISYFNLAQIAIKMGKPQILEYLVNIYRFDQNQINVLCKEIEKYSNQEPEDSEEDSDIEDIIQEYESIIKNTRKLPYKKNIKKNTR